MAVPSRRDLYRTMRRRGGKVLPIPGVKRAYSEQLSTRAGRIHDYLQSRSRRMNKPCDYCDDRPADEANCICVDDDPWSEDCWDKCFCSEDCMMNYEGEQVFTCEECSRTIR